MCSLREVTDLTRLSLSDKYYCGSVNTLKLEYAKVTEKKVQESLDNLLCNESQLKLFKLEFSLKDFFQNSSCI